jgi:hypothetical protein
MKVSFTLGVGEDVRVNNIPCRVLTENLTRNPNFDVTFLNYTITANVNLQKDTPEYINKIEKENRVLRECTTSWYTLFQVAYSNYHYIDLLLNEIKTEYLFYSCSALQIEFAHIAQILNHGIKVIIGGSLLNSYTFQEIRDIVSLIAEKKYMKNLMIVKGYVDLTTDLYTMVREWKDVEITENDFTTFWECTEDYTVEKVARLKKMGFNFLEYYPFEYSVFILDNKCWWNKCRFCTYPLYQHKDFTVGSTASKISNNIIAAIRKYDNGVFFTNDYFQFTPKYKEILQNLVDEGIKIVIFSGIQAFKNKSYIENINKYISAVKLGVESFSDFSLQYNNKGYTYADIRNVMQSIKEDMKSDVSFLANMIVDLPINNEAEIIENYEKAAEFKKELLDAGHPFNFSAKLLTINKDQKERFIDNRFVTVGDSNISGRYLVFDMFRRMGVIKDDTYKTMSLPLLRFDENGNELSTDFSYISHDLAVKTFRWIRRKNEG